MGKTVSETTLIIDLNSISHNLDVVRSNLNSNCKIIGVVKADAYGFGAIEIGKALVAQGVNHLAVSTIDEGIELRDSGIECNIIVLFPFDITIPAIIDYKLEPTIYNLTVLNNLISTIDQIKDIKTPITIHLEVDTGMRRLGFDNNHDLIAALETIKSRDQQLKVGSIFTHLATADHIDDRSFTLEQIDLFNNFCEVSSKTVGYRVDRHVQNSAGIKYFDLEYEYARLGISLYGLTQPEDSMLLPVATLTAPILDIHNLEIGDSVSYGRRFIATKPTRIASIRIGYADGLDRALGNGVGEVYIQNHKIPIVGAVCMDISMIDITDIPGIKVGDTVEIFGKKISVGEIANKLDKINYEIITSISQRIRRLHK